MTNENDPLPAQRACYLRAGRNTARLASGARLDQEEMRGGGMKRYFVSSGALLSAHDHYPHSSVSVVLQKDHLAAIEAAREEGYRDGWDTAARKRAVLLEATLEQGRREERDAVVALAQKMLDTAGDMIASAHGQSSAAYWAAQRDVLHLMMRRLERRGEHREED